MVLSTRKLNLIQFLLNLKDEKLFSEIEYLIISNDKDFKSFTKNELIKRAKKSNEDYLNGKFISQEDLETQSENW